MGAVPQVKCGGRATFLGDQGSWGLRLSVQAPRIKWIALKPGNVYAVRNYRIHKGSVTYVLSSGARGSVDVTEVDWRKTSHLNAEPIASLDTTRAANAGDAEPLSARH